MTARGTKDIVSRGSYDVSREPLVIVRATIRLLIHEQHLQGVCTESDISCGRVTSCDSLKTMVKVLPQRDTLIIRDWLPADLKTLDGLTATRSRVSSRNNVRASWNAIRYRRTRRYSQKRKLLLRITRNFIRLSLTSLIAGRKFHQTTGNIGLFEMRLSRAKSYRAWKIKRRRSWKFVTCTHLSLGNL